MTVRKALSAGGAMLAAAALVAGCGSSSGSGGDSAAAAGTTTVRIMVGGLDKQIYLPAMLTERLGYFKQEGLDVQLSDEPAGVEAADQLLAGKVDGVVGFYDHTVDLQGSGKQAQSVVQLLKLPGEAVMCSNNVAGSVSSPADW